METRSEVINLFGEELGQILIDEGYASISSLLELEGDYEQIPNVGPARAEEIEDALAPIVEELDGTAEPGDHAAEGPSGSVEEDAGEVQDEPEDPEAAPDEAETEADEIEDYEAAYWEAQSHIDQLEMENRALKQNVATFEGRRKAVGELLESRYGDDLTVRTFMQIADEIKGLLSV